MNEDDDVSFLDVRKEDLVPVPPNERVWAQINDECQLGYIDWAMVNALAAQFDELHKSNQEKTESHVICKLLVLVRELTKEETEFRVRAEYKNVPI